LSALCKTEVRIVDVTPTQHPLVETHAQTLSDARAALAARSYFSRYPESPSPRVYGESAAAEGLAAFATDPLR